MGATQRKSLVWGVGALALLLAVSAWRWWQLRGSSSSPLAPYAVYAAYALLVCLWLRSMRRRVAQPSTRRFIVAEGALMFFGATVRFVQDTLLASDPALMRASGYLFVVPLAFLPLLGLLGSLGTGRRSDFRVRGAWWLLLAPAGFFVLAALLDPRLHLLFWVDPAEPQPNMLFHPSVGAYLLLGWFVGLTFARIGLLTVRNRRLGVRRRPWPALFVGVFMLVVVAPYFGTSFAPDPDFVEFYVRVFTLEAVLWESCIASGLVPVNTAYDEVLRSSTIAMQILDQAGARITGSSDAPEVTPQQFEALRSGERLDVGGGMELCATPCARNTWCVWLQDMHELRRSLEELEGLAGELSRRSDLLAQELRTRGEAERVRSREFIYQCVEREIGLEVAQLSDLLGRLVGILEEERRVEKGCAGASRAEQDHAEKGRTGEGKADLPGSDVWRDARQKELLRGEMIKQRCMSRLEELGDG